MNNFLQKAAFWRNEKISEEDILGIEDYLYSALYPVNPSSTFVQSLRSRLMDAPEPVNRSKEIMQYSLLGLAGVLSGIIIIVTGIRATVTILGALGLLRQARNRSNRQRPAPV